MASAVMIAEEGIEHPQSLETQLDDAGVVHVVYLKVIGLSGILLDSQATKATVSRNKDMLIPPRQMKASLAVVRGSQVYGISPESKRLSRIVPSPAADEVATNQQQQLQQQQQQQQQRPVRRYVAVWDNSTIKTTTKPNGEIAASTADSTILFETILMSSSASSTTSAATNVFNVSSFPSDNFQLIVGLVSAAGTSVNTTSTIPLGIATLPLTEAAALRGSSGKVVLDLPIQNVTDLCHMTNPFVKNDIIELQSDVVKVKSKRNIFAALMRRKNVTPSTANVCSDLSTKIKKPCIYTLDTSTGNETATLRVELELHEKESNVEMGLESSLYLDVPYTINTDCMQTDGEKEVNEVAVVVPPTDDKSICVTEASTHPILGDTHCDYSVENEQLEPSIERVLSIRGTSTKFRSLFQFSPTRRFRVNCNHTDSKFDLTPVPAVEYSPEQEVEAVVLQDENDAKTRFLDLTFDRLLSMEESDDQVDNEEDVPLNRNDVPFDEQSFLSRDAVAMVRDKPAAIKKSDLRNESPIMMPPSLNLQPEPSSKNFKLTSFWNRGKNCSSTDNLSASISVTATESSTHSVSNTESDIESPPRIGGTVKKVLLPDANNMLHSSLIDVPSSDHAFSNGESVISLPAQPTKSVLKPVSILRKTNKAGSEKVGMKSDAQSVVSSSAETEVMKKSKPHVDYEEHFNQIIKELTDVKTPVTSDGPDTDSTESMQSSSTNTSPPSPNSTYSTPLPSFVSEESEPVVMQDKLAPGKAEKVEVKTPRKKRVENLKPNIAVAITTDKTELPQQTRSILPKRNLLAQNLYGLIDIPPCTMKFDQFLAHPEDEELMSIDESWINENSTIDTYKTQRQGTMHDDLADLGLLWGDMCRQTGFRGDNDDDSLLAEASTRKDRIATRQRWMAGLRRSYRHHRTGYEYDEIDDNDHSQSSGISGGSFTDENTIRSTTEESESGYSELGTEVDVDDVNGNCNNIVETPTKLCANKSDLVIKSLSLKQHGNQASRFAQSSKSIVDDDAFELAGNTNHTPLHSTTTSSKNGVDQKLIEKTSTSVNSSHYNTHPNNTSSLPPKAPRHTQNEKVNKLVAPTMNVRSNTAIDGSYYSSGSNTESATPQSFQPPKSITQSLVDFVEYVISPSPTPSVTMIPNVPTVLDTDDAASVGELTATTYERQVEVDEMRRQSKSQLPLSPSTSPLESSLDNRDLENVFEQPEQMGTVAISNDKTYFSEYDGDEKISISPEVAAAMEAAAAKQMADDIH
jgi:hypothetical protein